MKMTTEEEQYIEDNLECVDVQEEFIQIRGEYYWPEEVQRHLKKIRIHNKLKFKG